MTLQSYYHPPLDGISSALEHLNLGDEPNLAIALECILMEDNLSHIIWVDDLIPYLAPVGLVQGG